MTRTRNCRSSSRLGAKLAGSGSPISCMSYHESSSFTPVPKDIDTAALRRLVDFAVDAEAAAICLPGGSAAAGARQRCGYSRAAGRGTGARRRGSSPGRRSTARDRPWRRAAQLAARLRRTQERVRPRAARRQAGCGRGPR